MVIKGGMIAASLMGDPNASIPTPQPVHYREMFGAFGRARAATSVTFVSKAAMEANVRDELGLAKECVAIENVRGGISKADMVLNDATPDISVDPETYEVQRGWRAPGVRAGDGTADGATLLPVLRAHEC